MNKYIGKHKNELPTPSLVIDKNKLIYNLELMRDLAKQKKVNLRPHAKTHKCSQLARLQLEYGAIGICVTKVSEALIMAKAGITGILITSPIVSFGKFAVLLEVLDLAPDTLLVVDSLSNALQLNEFCQKHSCKLNILLDIDGGISRTGVSPDNAIELALAIDKLPNLLFRGIQCYAGHLQHIPDLAERRIRTHEILSSVGLIKRELLVGGLNCEIQTGSGTGTFSIDAELDCVTEIQPGSYCVMDQEYSNIEYKEPKFLPAMTMLTTVISTNQDTHVTVDAGTKALYRVATKPFVISHPDLQYDWDGFGDEHGKVTALNGAKLPDLGEVLELVVAHCDPTINLFDYFYITDNDTVVDYWKIDARGCCQ
ncbi:MAG: DSD1 family PLP-dependent enzyme [Neisseriales bacterium]|nr:MAG: DSD1 family PLP-dependent enzyme [Neisseriales bacterium]